LNAVQRLGQDPRGRSFPDPARPDKKVGMREPVLLNSIPERTDNMLLPDQVVEGLRPVFSRENLVAHGSIYSAGREPKTENRKQERIYRINTIFLRERLRRAFFLIH